MENRIGDKLTYQRNDQWGNPSDQIEEYICVFCALAGIYNFQGVDVDQWLTFTAQELHARANDGFGRILTYTEKAK